MAENDELWHCFEDRDNYHLFCVQSSGKDAAAVICKDRLGAIYDHTKHLYSYWRRAEDVCDIYRLDYDLWKKCLIHMHDIDRTYGLFSGKISGIGYYIYVVPSQHNTKESQSYGATCINCKDLFPYAVTVNNFKCWKCSHGY